jgi:hypothetical protein
MGHHNNMQSGSLTIGVINASYGGGSNWSSNTAGLMMECASKTEIDIHDSLQVMQQLNDDLAKFN